MARLKTHYKKYADGGAVDLKVPEPSDDASTAFQGQIDALRRAEHFAEVARQPQHGLTPRQQAFLDQHPRMLDEPERLGAAILKAHQQNHEIDSDAFHNAVAENFRLHHLEADPQPEPEFYKPKPLPERRNGAIFSAPVSREGTTATRGGDYDSNNPGRVKLSAQEKEICRALGQSEVDYARGKIELARRKSEGHFDR